MKYFFGIALIGTLLCESAAAENVRWIYKSPNDKFVVDVERSSEDSDFTVTVKQGDKTLWSYHPHPEDKSVKICWQPTSGAFLMEHVTRHDDYRLYIVSLVRDYVRMFPITVEPGLHPSSIIKGTVVWEKTLFERGNISLTIRDRQSLRRKVRINVWRSLETEKPKDKGRDKS